jgi:hypothetical protein
VAPILVRAELFPLVVIDMPAHFALDDLASFTQTIEALYARKERFATLVDSRLVKGMPDAAVRKRLGDWQNETKHLIAKHNVFTATVIESAVVRGAMTAIHWVFRPPNEQVTVGSYDEGFRGCIEALRRDGLTLPPALERVARGATPKSSTSLFARAESA